MVAGSILPISIHDNQIYFLFGKENPLEDSAPGWSDFGGGVEKKETPIKTALREGGEELTGFLGDGNTIQQLMKKSGVYKIVHNDYHVHIFLLDYDTNLPKYYNQNHSFLWDRMDHTTLSQTKLFEKIEIGWFSENDLVSRRSQFRPFYREIVDKVREQMPKIKKQWMDKKSKFRKKVTFSENNEYININTRAPTPYPHNQKNTKRLLSVHGTSQKNSKPIKKHIYNTTKTRKNKK